MKTKATIFIALVCLLMTGAVAALEPANLVRADKPRAVDVNGITGNIGLVPAQYVATYPTPVMTTTEDAYTQQCSKVRLYLFNNPDIKLGREYRIMDCVLQHKEVTTGLTPCGRMIASYDANGNKLPYKVHANKCRTKRNVWTPIQI